jgi:hypothetical protein
VKATRAAWFERQLDLDPTRLIFIDETAASAKMARLRGWAPKPCGDPSRTLEDNALPACSPDFNPIEMALSTRRCCAPQPRARSMICGRLSLTPIECQNYFAAAGYDAIWAENALEDELKSITLSSMIEKIEEQEALIKGYARIKKRIERRVSVISNLVAEYSRYYHHSLLINYSFHFLAGPVGGSSINWMTLLMTWFGLSRLHLRSALAHWITNLI